MVRLQLVPKPKLRSPQGMDNNNLRLFTCHVTFLRRTQPFTVFFKTRIYLPTSKSMNAMRERSVRERDTQAQANGMVSSNQTPILVVSNSVVYTGRKGHYFQSGCGREHHGFVVYTSIIPNIPNQQKQFVEATIGNE